MGGDGGCWSGRNRAREVATVAWAMLGVLALVVVAGLVLRNLMLVVVPLILAFFPATLLAPLTRQLERWRIPRVVAALITLVGGLLLLFGVFAGVITWVVAEIPAIVDSAGQGVDRVEELVGRFFPGFEVPAVNEVGQMIRERIGGMREASGDESEEAGGIASRGLSVATSAAEVLTGVILTVVILFFFLQGGRDLAAGFVGFVAPRSRDRLMEFADEAWRTLGAYFRGQLLVALADAVLIGVGLLILGVPLAMPLAVIVFFGGLFPIIGAVVSGALAVLVAFSDGGLGTALTVIGLVLIVQQLEGNVLAPLILSNVINLHPLTVILSIAVGALVLGVLGAFLAVPVAAIIKKVVVRLREQRAAGLVSATAT